MYDIHTISTPVHSEFSSLCTGLSMYNLFDGEDFFILSGINVRVEFDRLTGTDHLYQSKRCEFEETKFGLQINTKLQSLAITL